ncbi:hypothetical protein EVAR_59014_1 [Eumeta japonica]|uniref:Uncharacterized protein n=1 Tax=Eumeta variegata TaxID=151549 RepID=A0A4C1ZMV4_EUMVA|nr:hypothetical protein EVAR_59014_1 [Eumeta japonica]
MDEESVNSEIAAATAQRALPTSLRHLAVYLGERSELEVKSRIPSAESITADQRVPAALDGDHSYTKLCTAWLHQLVLHGGRETVVNERNGVSSKHDMIVILSIDWQSPRSNTMRDDSARGRSESSKHNVGTRCRTPTARYRPPHHVATAYDPEPPITYGGTRLSSG